MERLKLERCYDLPNVALDLNMIWKKSGDIKTIEVKDLGI